MNLRLIKYSRKTYSVDECIDECYRLMNNGYPCAAFEYSLDNSTCRFLENSVDGTATKYYTPNWDHYMLTNTKRKLNTNLQNLLKCKVNVHRPLIFNLKFQ